MSEIFYSSLYEGELEIPGELHSTLARLQREVQHSAVIIISNRVINGILLQSSSFDEFNTENKNCSSIKLSSLITECGEFYLIECAYALI